MGPRRGCARRRCPRRRSPRSRLGRPRPGRRPRAGARLVARPRRCRSRGSRACGPRVRRVEHQASPRPTVVGEPHDVRGAVPGQIRCDPGDARTGSHARTSFPPVGSDATPAGSRRQSRRPTPRPCGSRASTRTPRTTGPGTCGDRSTEADTSGRSWTAPTSSTSPTAPRSGAPTCTGMTTSTGSSPRRTTTTTHVGGVQPRRPVRDVPRTVRGPARRPLTALSPGCWWPPPPAAPTPDRARRRP